MTALTAAALGFPAASILLMLAIALVAVTRARPEDLPDVLAAISRWLGRRP
jgi:hypothetical protein